MPTRRANCRSPYTASVGRNGTFMVYRKLHQNVATFRAYLDAKAELYPGGKEKLAANLLVARRDGDPSGTLCSVPTRPRSR